jgi:hypothetical protein
MPAYLTGANTGWKADLSKRQDPARERRPRCQRTKARVWSEANVCFWRAEPFRLSGQAPRLYWLGPLRFRPRSPITSRPYQR